MIVNSLVLIDGKNLTEEALRISLGNAKQIVLRRVTGFGFIVHIAADSLDYLGKALLAFAKIPGVTEVTTLAIRN